LADTILRQSTGSLKEGARSPDTLQCGEERDFRHFIERNECRPGIVQFSVGQERSTRSGLAVTIRPDNDKDGFGEALGLEPYKKLMNELKPERQRQLQEAQRIWLKYMEANCAFYLDPDGGTAAQLAASECRVLAKAARAKELEAFMQ
jgi:hypothetical protein